MIAELIVMYLSIAFMLVIYLFSGFILLSWYHKKYHGRTYHPNRLKEMRENKFTEILRRTA